MRLDKMVYEINKRYTQLCKNNKLFVFCNPERTMSLYKSWSRVEKHCGRKKKKKKRHISRFARSNRHRHRPCLIRQAFESPAGLSTLLLIRQNRNRTRSVSRSPRNFNATTPCNTRNIAVNKYNK
ncbi:hypothetical protein PUN28_017722 [Cardiocondyla obscurior]|uniref:Uncharacterized protein n=1 Tax=Cardiocondyla obscurior TaxID=286306 RepID=A0AAW2EIT0_9HYME